MQGDRNTKRRSHFKHCLKLGISLLIPLVLHSQAVADDIDVYYPEANSVPNILFVVDASGSMGREKDGTGFSRMQRMKAALQSTLQEIKGVKVGLMQFRDDHHAKMLVPVAPLESTEFSGGGEVHRTVMIDAVNSLPTSGNTPTVEALHEAALYFAGKPVSSEAPTAAGILADDGSYRAPSFDGCQSSSYIVLVTDGLPKGRVYTGKMESLVGKNCRTYNTFGGLESELVCGREIVNALAHKNGYNKFTEKPIHLFTVGLGIS